MKTQYLPRDIARARQWYADHKDHVKRIIQDGHAGLSIQNEFPMSGSDIARPELWKSGAWRWFLRRYAI
jgi:hypothetical protein